MPSAPAKYAIEVTDRDLEVLRGLFESRVMTAEHIAAIHFDGHYEAARKRMQKLKAAGYVGERPRRAYDPAVLFMTKRAFALLCERGTISHYPHLTWKSLEKRVRVSPLTLKHELEIQDVKAAMVQTIAKSPGFEVAEFNTWPLMSQFKAYTPAGAAVTVKPDGFIRLRQITSAGETLEYTFYLEVDRSTEVLETLAERAHCYRDHYRRGGLAIHNGRPASEFEQFPFRVLMIFKNAERRNNVAERLLACRPPILSQVWLTTFAELIKEPLGSIWVRPADYRDAIGALGFPALSSLEPVYRRRPQRESEVERKVQKHGLFMATVERNNQLR